MRHDGRKPDELRPIDVQRQFVSSSPGSVYIRAGRTAVLCTASIEDVVPSWKEEQETPGGWITAEYSMLPGSTTPRKRRERGRIDSRSTEIQRLIGRSLRAAVDLETLGPRTLTIDCDVLEADGGTRTLSITGGFIAMVDALRTLRDSLSSDRPILRCMVAAVSVGVVDGTVLLDLDYHEDSQAEVDMNVVMTSSGQFVEIQGTAESGTFDRKLLEAQLELAEDGISQLLEIQQVTLGREWPLDELLR
ncbi:MAG: ribonuclease PH [Planctomycetes bacterium]|nr:ribonuclease PH [Planctomycetota bacterium]